MFCRFQEKAGNLENDADTGLMYYGARYYSPGYRIFVQPDTMLPDPYNPQALNRYAYALDNPLKYTDPSGHFVEILIDAPFLAVSAHQFHEEPNLVNGAFLVWDITAVVLPYVPGSWAVRTPKAIQSYRNYLISINDLPTVAEIIYKTQVCITEVPLSKSINLIIDDVRADTSSVNNYFKEAFGTDAFNDVNFDGCSFTGIRFGEDVFDTIKDEEGYYLIGVNEKTGRSLWENEDGDSKIIDHTNEEKDDEDK